MIFKIVSVVTKKNDISVVEVNAMKGVYHFIYSFLYTWLLFQEDLKAHCSENSEVQMCCLWRAKHNNIDNNSMEDALCGFMWNTRDLSFSSIVFEYFFFPFPMIPEKKFNQAFAFSPRKEQFVFEMNYRMRDWNGPVLMC